MITTPCPDTLIADLTYLTEKLGREPDWQSQPATVLRDIRAMRRNLDVLERGLLETTEGGSESVHADAC